ncbi:MAG: hypothetical protein R3F48_12730 [Candidatus Zixiibacteriota bacterium]
MKDLCRVIERRHEIMNESELIIKCLQILKEGKESPKTLSRIARAIEEMKEIEEW